MKITYIFLVALLALVLLSGCSSPEEKAVAHLANAEQLLARGKLQKARIEYANALQLNQNQPQAWYGLARIHEQREEWKKAYNILIRVRDTNPKYIDARVMLTKLLLASNQIDKALEDARDIVELSPDDARAHAIMASVMSRLGDAEAAWQSVERALALDAVNEEVMLMKASLLISEKKYMASLDVLDKALQVKPDNVSFYLMKLTVFDELDDESSAEQTYKSLIQRFPDRTEFRDVLIRRYIRAGKIDQAERLLQQPVEENPDSVNAKLRLVIFKSQHRSLDDAINLLRTYVEDDEDEYEFKFVLGELYARNEKVDQSIEVYQGIIEEEELGSHGLEARNRIARIYVMSGKLSESRALVDEVLAHDQNNQDGLLLRARFYLASGIHDAAIVDLRTVLRDNPKSIEALELIGRAHQDMGADNLAIETLAQAFEMRPESADIADRLAKILIRTRRPDRADEILTKSIEAGNQGVEALRLLTQAKMMLGKWTQAEQLAQRLKEFEGQASASQHVLGLVYQSRDQYEESAAAFRRAYDLDPMVDEPVVSLVKVYLQNNQLDKAWDFLLSVVVDNPENVTAYQLLGQLSLRENDVPAAIRYFEHSIRANPELETGYLRLAAIYLAENQLQKAENIFQKGLLAIPYSLELSMNLALVVERQGDFERAITLYEKLLRENPDIIIAKNNLASLLIDYRDDATSHARARELAGEFRDSRIPLFRDTYAWASVRSDLYLEEAAAILQSIVKDNETVGVFQYHLGEAYRKKGSSFDARRHLRRAIELEGPESPIAIEAQKTLEMLSQ